MMPATIEWPRSVSAEYPDRGARPLHFLAQIACADLPAALWGGLGPRRGWLLFFVDPNQGVPDGPDAFRILHTATLGAERPPPADLGPVHDGVYTGPSYDHCRSPADVPSLWRRWPVDLVTVPNAARIENGRTLVAPENFAAILYEGAPVAPDRQRPPDPAPFSWRGALYVLDGLARSLAKPWPELQIPARLVEWMNEPGYLTTILSDLDAREAAWAETHRARLEGPEPADEAERARRAHLRAGAAKRGRERAALAAFLTANVTPDSVIAALRHEDDARRRWRTEAAARVAAERASVLAHDLDTPLSAEGWAALETRLQQDTVSSWVFRWVERGGERLHVSFEEIETRLLSGQRTGIGELVADYYVDPARRALIPPAVVAAFEPHWRSLYSNRPHRIGGYHDGLQSDAEIGPARELLVFQIATDDAMQWCWGDAGAYYVFAAPDALERLDFSDARLDLECH
ncbi:hypothetical protein sos41_43100 [Alphaproteobacteria bacterium SO-S41]|nr:hypothetical protein sos41_43100 [Alphaproteobacteria bacterium SO-S41]